MCAIQRPEANVISASRCFNGRERRISVRFSLFDAALASVMRSVTRRAGVRGMASQRTADASKRAQRGEFRLRIALTCALVLCVGSCGITLTHGAGIWGLDEVYDGIGYNPDFPNQACGPSEDGTSFRETGCVPYITDKDSHGTPGDPGFSFAKWAYKGKSYGPPYNDVADTAACTYALTLEVARASGLEHCFYAPYTGGVATTAAQKLSTNLGYSTLGWRLPAAEWREKLPDYVMTSYEVPPLRLGFEEGTFWPNWKLLSSGLPNFAVVKKCFLEAHSGDYQLCSAYPESKREDTHGVLHVQSISFSLGKGNLMFEANGGDQSVPDIPQDPYIMSAHSKGVLGIALTRISDDYRVLTKSIRARRYWETMGWTAEELEPYEGEVFRLEIFDYRAGLFGWLAVDSFVIPQARVVIQSISPVIGSRSGGERITITGLNFGSSVDDKTVFVGDQECTDLRMSYSRCSSDNIQCVSALTCTTPAGEGSGLPVAVVIGEPSVVRAAGPRGGFQAGFCGDESIEHPFSECSSDENIGADVLITGPRKRGFTYADPPEITSIPITDATQDVQYKYTMQATDADEGDVLTYTAIDYPSFLQFDPTTALLTGTPYRSDVQCRSDKWHPVEERCAEGATYDVHLQVSDGVYTVDQKFQITVMSNETSALIDKSFHWENAVQIRKKYEQVVELGSVTESLTALQERNVTNMDEIIGFFYRNPLNDADEAIRSGLIAIAESPNIDEVQVDAAIQYLEDIGVTETNRDMIQTLKEQVAFEKQTAVLAGASTPALQGVTWRGWLNYFKQLGRSLSTGTVVYTNTDSLRAPPGASRMLSREKVIVIQLSTPCNKTGTYTDRYIHSCDLIGMSALHEIWLGFSDLGTTLEDVIITPEDFEQSDLITAALFTQDVPGFMNQLTTRLIAQSAKLQEISQLNESYAVWFDTSTSMLTVNMTVKESPVSVVMQIASSYPYPEPGKYGLPEIKVHSCDVIVNDLDIALAEISKNLTRSGGSLTSRMASLEEEVERFATVCKNSCSNSAEIQRGQCITDTLPPRCACQSGLGFNFTGDDCSQTTCPNDCSGNGVCDSKQECTHNPESGETDCMGGTGKCSCFYPYFGNDCSLQACPKNFIVFEGNSTHPFTNSPAQVQAFRTKYTDMGFTVADVQISNTNGDTPPAWSIEGDALSVANLVGAAYVLFQSSVDGQSARSQEPFYRDSIPSRGDALQAQYFAEEYRALTKREQQLLGLFGKSSSECNGAGSCAFERGECACASPTFGPGCEFRTCPNNCAGHGSCNTLDGTCTCETYYQSDSVAGCALKDYGLISTSCTDQVVDSSVDQFNFRVNPLQASCLFGTALGSLVPEVDAGAVPPVTPPTTFVSRVDGNVCLDCSGYTDEDNSQIYYFKDEPCSLTGRQNVAGVDDDACDITKTNFDTIVRGLGMIPQSGTGSSVTFDLVAMRDSSIVFSAFKTRAGIVREHLEDISQGGCGPCTSENPQCGANFAILVDGVQVWSSKVVDEYSGDISIDISAADTLTLQTSSITPTYWRSNTAPGQTGQNVPAVWCDGAAWAGAEFH